MTNAWTGIGWFALLLLGNGFFVGAEFALMSARRAQIEPRAEAGSGPARITIKAMEKVSLMLAATQLGVTICSLMILLIVEPSMHELLHPLLSGFGEEVAGGGGVGLDGVGPAPVASGPDVEAAELVVGDRDVERVARAEVGGQRDRVPRARVRSRERPTPLLFGVVARDGERRARAPFPDPDARRLGLDERRLPDRRRRRRAPGPG